MDKKSSPNPVPEPKKRKKITQSYLENAGAYYLERFSASVASFRRVMERKIRLSCQDHPEQDQAACRTLLEEVIGKFQRLGYLNDESYARGLIQSLENRGKAYSRIKLSLVQKGLDSELIERVLPDKNLQRDRLSALRWAKKKRLGPYALQQKEGDLRRGLASLSRAGFDFDLAQWVMQIKADDLEKTISGIESEIE